MNTSVAIRNIKIEALWYLVRSLVDNPGYNSGCSIDLIDCTVDEWSDDVAMWIASALGLLSPMKLMCTPFNSPDYIFYFRVFLKVVGHLRERAHHEFLERFGPPELRLQLKERYHLLQFVAFIAIFDLRKEY